MQKMQVVFKDREMNNIVCHVTKVVVTRNRVKCFATDESGRDILVRDSVIRNLSPDGTITVFCEGGDTK